MTKNNINDMVLTVALKHAGNIKVQTALVEGKNDRAREYLTGYIELSIEEAKEQDITVGLPHERAAGILMMAHGPLVRGCIGRVVESLIPNF